MATDEGTVTTTSAPDPADASTDQISKQDQHEENTQTKPKKGRHAVLIFSLLLSLGLIALDSNIITTALPTIAKDFSISNSAFSWTGGAILLAQAVFGPFFAKVSDIFGRKPTILGSIVIFMIGSIVCSRSNSAGMLIAGRAIQGVGAGGIRVMVSIIGGDIFSEKERATYFGLIGLVFATCPTIGPLIGAGLTMHAGWRWCFYINLPLDAIVIVMLVLYLEVHNPRTPIKQGLPAIDWLGSLLVVGGTTMFLLGLQFGGTVFPWSSATVICLLVFGIFTIAIFLAYEAWVPEYPVMPIYVFKDPKILPILAFAFCHGTIIFSLAYYFITYLQEALGKSPVMSGVIFLSVTIPLGISAIISGVMVRKKGHIVEWIRGGILLMAVALGLLLDLPAYTSWARLIIYNIIGGSGMATGYQLPVLALQVRVKPEQIATATSTFAFMQMLGSSIGVTLGAVVFQANIRSQAPTLLSAGIPPEIVHALISGSAFSSSKKYSDLLSPAQTQKVRDVLTSSFHKIWIFLLGMACLGLLASLAIRNKDLKTEHVIYKTGLKKILGKGQDDEDDKEKVTEQDDPERVSDEETGKVEAAAI